jgi:hypothetical protein
LQQGQWEISIRSVERIIEVYGLQKNSTRFVSMLSLLRVIARDAATDRNLAIRSVWNGCTATSGQ